MQAMLLMTWLSLLDTVSEFGLSLVLFAISSFVYNVGNVSLFA